MNICSADFCYSIELDVVDTQLSQNLCQHTITLLKTGNGIHDFVIRGMATGLVQLERQICQFSGMGSVVSNHIFHQSHQLVHGGMVVIMVMVFMIMMMMVVMMVMMIVMMVFVLVIKVHNKLLLILPQVSYKTGGDFLQIAFFAICAFSKIITNIG